MSSKEGTYQSFISLFFICIFPVAVAGYYFLPSKYRNIWLLFISYFAYWRWNNSFIFLLLFVTIISYLGSIICDKYNSKLILGIEVVITLLLLFFYKYSILLLNTVGIKTDYSWTLPVGISFFTFQALSYEIDVFRKDTIVEKNIIKYALFISFFPQLVAGPIEKSKKFLKQFDETHSFNERNVTKGFIQMLWGYFLKLVIADRVAVVVDTIYGNITVYRGFYLSLAAILFLIQIYCDFYGYSLIAVGAARTMGFELTDNFKTPFLSKSVSEFWRRWHISLSTWFKEYLYIPLGGSKKGKARKYINLIIVFGISGMWHGANWTFLIWGLLNAIYQIVEDFTKKVKRNYIMSNIVTFLLVAFSFIFFRSSSVIEGFEYIKNMFGEWNPEIFVNGALLHLGLNINEIIILVSALCILFTAEIIKYKKITFSDIVLKQNIIARYVIYVVAFTIIIIFGCYGDSTNSFIYFAF